MDAKSLFLTPNADTVYAIGVVDLTKGPMVLELPPKWLGTINDIWFSWVTDIGCPGPIAARAASTCSCRRATTVRCRRAASSSPAPGTVRVVWYGPRVPREQATIRSRRSKRSGSSPKIYPYEAGGCRHSASPSS